MRLALMKVNWQYLQTIIAILQIEKAEIMRWTGMH